MRMLLVLIISILMIQGCKKDTSQVTCPVCKREYKMVGNHCAWYECKMLLIPCQNSRCSQYIAYKDRSKGCTFCGAKWVKPKCDHKNCKCYCGPQKTKKK